MRSVVSSLCGLAAIAVCLAGLPGCGERAGGYTYETTLDESLDVYVHPLSRPVLELAAEVPESLRGAEALGGSNPKFTEIPIGNINDEHQYLAVFDSPEDAEASLRILVDTNVDLDLSDEEPHRLRPYREGSPYFLSDTLIVSFSVDVSGKPNLVDRKIHFILKRSEDEEWLRYELVGHRTGQFDHLGGEPFGYILFDADYNGYFDYRDLLVIDTNRDGEIDGNRNSVERYVFSDAFLLGERPYRTLGLNPEGTRFSIMPYKGDVVPRDRLEVGEFAPDFTLEDFTGESVRLSQHSGKAVLLVFWATW